MLFSRRVAPNFPSHINWMSSYLSTVQRRNKEPQRCIQVCRLVPQESRNHDARQVCGFWAVWASRQTHLYAYGLRARGLASHPVNLLASPAASFRSGMVERAALPWELLVSDISFLLILSLVHSSWESLRTTSTRWPAVLAEWLPADN